MHRLLRHLVVPALAGWLAVRPAVACELCAVYRAADARGDYGTGFTATTALQFVPYHTEQFNGAEFHRANPDFLDRSIIHVVGSYNLTENLGLSLNLPVIHQSYRRLELENGIQPRTLQGDETGLGDLTLVARWRVWNHSAMDHGFGINLLGGLKLPTGDSAPLDDQKRQFLAYEAIVGPGHNHDALGQVVSGIHAHDLALGSGSVDGVLGATANARWHRTFFNAQAQYYLRSPGAGSYRYADEFTAGGGPGAFLRLHPSYTLSLQGSVVYDTRGSDELLGRASIHTGLTAWYAGPQLAFTWKEHLSVVAGVELPFAQAGRGFQNVADYRLNAGVTVRF